MFIFALFVCISKFELSQSESEFTTGMCNSHMRMVNSLYIFDEDTENSFGIINGEPFLNEYLNDTRFVASSQSNCADACFK